MPITSIRSFGFACASLIATSAGVLLTCAAASAQPQGDPQRGAYLVKAGGCMACHTEEKKDAAAYAGGRALKTPFGTFYGPNITPDQINGIGKWSEADFVRAMRTGIRPDGAAYYPAFPYPSYTKISDADLRDLWAYLRSLPPSNRANQSHELGIPYRFRALNRIWQWMFFTPGALSADASKPAQINRGAYLVQALGHCGECHTPRNMLGGPKLDRFLGGGIGPEGKGIPNLTPTRLKKWSDKDLSDYLSSGLTPDGDVPAEAMAEVIRNTTGQLAPEDLNALIAYLRTIPAVADAAEKK